MRIWRTNDVVDGDRAQRDAQRTHVRQHQHKQQAQAAWNIEPVDVLRKLKPFEVMGV